jgi:hypothetical protein
MVFPTHMLLWLALLVVLPLLWAGGRKSPDLGKARIANISVPLQFTLFGIFGRRETRELSRARAPSLKTWSSR